MTAKSGGNKERRGTGVREDGRETKEATKGTTEGEER
jgi:hypothetical protein